MFPRLSTRRPELAEALAALSAEHPAQIALQNAVAEHAKQLDDESRPGAGKALLEVAERLAEQHRQHVHREDEIFAAAHEALTEQDDADIVAEMETRRDRDGEDGGHIRAGGRHGGGGGGGRGTGRGRGGGRGAGRGSGGGGGGGDGGRGRDHGNGERKGATKRPQARSKAKRAARSAAKSAKSKPTKRAAKTARATNAKAKKPAKATKSPRRARKKR